MLIDFDINLEKMLEQLYAFCEINSGSRNISGLAKMHDILKHAFLPIVDKAETHELPPVSGINLSGKKTNDTLGALLYLRKRPHLKHRVLLTGHMDTVYSENHPLQQVKILEPGILNGPGVADMKGGLIVILHALIAFEKTAFAKNIGWDVVINADEELGSPASAEFFKTIRGQYQAALVYEPASTIDGTFARSRKGSGKFTLVATGKSAHAGRDFDAGRNAITYLAEALLAINQLNQNQNQKNITINIAQINGGEALNIVPDIAVAKLDVRIAHPDDQDFVLAQFESIIKQLRRQDYTLSLHGEFGRPVKQINAASEALFKRLQDIAKPQELNIDWQDTGGCCDGNNLAEDGLAVIDTLGVRGGKIHSKDEFILIDSLIERVKLTTLLLIDLAQNGLET
jgi:glutamate carboxypeptidase